MLDYVLDKEYLYEYVEDNTQWSMKVAQDVVNSLSEIRLKADVNELYEIILTFVTEQGKESMKE